MKKGILSVTIDDLKKIHQERKVLGEPKIFTIRMEKHVAERLAEVAKAVGTSINETISLLALSVK